MEPELLLGCETGTVNTELEEKEMWFFAKDATDSLDRHKNTDNGP